MLQHVKYRRRPLFSIKTLNCADKIPFKILKFLNGLMGHMWLNFFFKTHLACILRKFVALLITYLSTVEEVMKIFEKILQLLSYSFESNK